MKTFFAHPLVSRVLGALGAGVTTFLASHDEKSAILIGVTFLVYGATHSTTSSAARSAGPSADA